MVAASGRFAARPSVQRVAVLVANWRLWPFLLSRTPLGQSLTRRGTALGFVSRRFSYAQHERLRDIRSASGATWSILRLATAPLICAALVLVALVAGPAFYDRFAATRRWAKLPFLPPPIESYSNVMGTIAQSAAAMLALFFAAISLVASTSYAKITSDIRALVAQDDLNRRYLQLLAHTAATATAGVGLHAVGLGGSTLLAWYVVCVAAVGLLAFLPLGVRTFALFDPSALTGYPMRRLARVLPAVTSKGRFWLQPPFQQHANRVADQQLRLLMDLLVLSIAEDRPRPIVVLNTGQAIAQLTRYYLSWKPHIPSDSLWFARRAEFKRWEVANGSVIGMALNTGVSPSPESVPDHGFIEARCTEMFVRCLQYLLARNAWEESAQLLLSINATATVAAQAFGQRETMQLVAAIRLLVVGELVQGRLPDGSTQALPLVDIMCVAALAPILNTPQALTAPSLEEQLDVSKAMLRLDNRGVYTRKQPRQVIRVVEDLLRRLLFERDVEGRIRTQPWYVRQIVAGGYADAIRDTIEGVVTTLQKEFLAPAAELAQAKRTLSAAAWLQRAIEACHKSKHQIQELEVRYGELRALHVTEVPWHRSGADDALARVEAARVTTIHALATLVPDLCSAPGGGPLPDLVGQARAWIAHELVDMMASKQEKGFAELFVAYFNASLSIYRHFVEYAKQPGREDYIRVAQDVALDLMDVSGLGYLFGEMDGTGFPKAVATAWDRWLGSATDSTGVVRACYSTIDSKMTLPIFSPSALQRQGWGNQLARSMIDRGIDVDRHLRGRWGGRESRPHASPVIGSVFVNYGHPMQHPYAYFGALYLAARPEAAGLAPPREVTRCLESIKRAQEQEGKKEAPGDINE